MTWHYLDDNCEHSTYSPEQAAESSEICSLDTIPSALSKLMPTASECSCNGSETECCHDSQSGMTCERLMGERGGERLTSSARASRVNRSVQLVSEKAKTTTETCGPTQGELFSKWDHRLCGWKTCQGSSPLQKRKVGSRSSKSEDRPTSELYCKTWPKWGSMRNGESYRLKTPHGLEEHRKSITREKGSGYSQRLPSPRAADGKHAGVSETPTTSNRLDSGKANLSEAVLELTKRSLCVPTPGSSKASNDVTLTCSGDGRKKPNKLGWMVATMERPLSEQIGGSLNPTWVEFLMGWPIGWTALEPLAMDKFQRWLELHGVSCATANS